MLEHNVSADVALRHKRATKATYARQAPLILRCLPELDEPDAMHLAATTTLITAAAWPYSRPPEALLAAYAADPTHGDLRHFGNSLAADAGASTKEMMHRLGQSSMRAALIYQHSTQKRDKEIAAGIDKRLAERLTEDDDDDGSVGVLVPIG